MPLLSYSIIAASAASLVTKTFVSTDDLEIAEIAKSFGAEVLDRPPELATDTATSNHVVQQCCSAWESLGQVPEIVVYLQATDIFRRRGIINRCIEVLQENPEYDSAFASFPDHKNYWIETEKRFQRINRNADTPRQLRTPMFREDTGIACATRFPVAKAVGRIGQLNRAVIHDDEFSGVDIHTADDLWLAEQIVRKFKGTGRYEF